MTFYCYRIAILFKKSQAKLKANKSRYSRDVLRTTSNIYDEAFCKKCSRLSPVNYFYQKFHPRIRLFITNTGFIFLKPEYFHSSTTDFLCIYDAFYYERKYHEMQRISNFQKIQTKSVFCNV